MEHMQAQPAKRRSRNTHALTGEGVHKENDAFTDAAGTLPASPPVHHTTPPIQARFILRPPENEQEIPPEQAETDGQNAPIQKAAASAPPPSPVATNHTGLPNGLKAGIENLSGYAMDDVKVHYNSGKPAELQAHAYAQGTDIYLAPGREKHLPHEAWHVAQQKQGRVEPTSELKGELVNNDVHLEREADVMGDRATEGMHSETETAEKAGNGAIAQKPVVQGVFNDDLEDRINHNKNNNRYLHELITGLRTIIHRLKDLIETSENTRGENIRFIDISELLEDAPRDIVDAFYDFALNKEPDQYDSVNIKLRELQLRELLKAEFGYDRVQDLVKALGGEGNEGATVEFIARGLGYGHVLAKDRAIINAMSAKYNTPANARRFLPGVINTGSTVPKSVPVRQGDKFYKLMSPGADPTFEQTHSPYYLSMEELEKAIGNTSVVEHKLGLPLQSYSYVYFVYEIEAKEDHEVFESKIAPTSQKVIPANRENKFFENAGGAWQTLILDSNDTTKWDKKARPVSIYDPVEIPEGRIHDSKDTLENKVNRF